IHRNHFLIPADISYLSIQDFVLFHNKHHLNDRFRNPVSKKVKVMISTPKSETGFLPQRQNL
ncbi:MAG: hypothetical protein AAGG53_18245, partial [Cyanobacteria bacterium P01_H01_bin.152]